MTFLSHGMAENQRFTFTSQAQEKQLFAVVNMEGVEAISQTWRFVLTLVCADGDVDLEKMLHYPATFRIYSENRDVEIPYHGMLSEFEQQHRSGDYVFYRAVLVPKLWRLALARESQVYLNEKSVPTILECVLKDTLFESDEYEFRLVGDYRSRSFVCQYQESPMNFLSRWLENEGMYYYFEHDTTDKLIIVDHRSMHAGQALSIEYRPTKNGSLGNGDHLIQDFVCRQSMLPKCVILEAYNYRKASVMLRAQAIVCDNGSGDVLISNENFRDEEEGRRYAKLRAEEISCTRKLFSGTGTAIGIRSGHFIELSQHYRASFNGRYLVTEVSHPGSQARAIVRYLDNPYSEAEIACGYSNHFQAIPATTQFRPQRKSYIPCISGTMTAIVDSEGEGGYADLDEYGQYKVKFPFNFHRRENGECSTRVRMATPYSGLDHGMHFPLHKGAEVLLAFDGGHPDQPVIIGSVANSENRNVVNNQCPQYSGINTKGGNQFCMEDTAGRESLSLYTPYNHTCIRLGAMNQSGASSPGNSGLSIHTTGNKEQITIGNNDMVTAGSSSLMAVGNAVSLSAAFNNNISAGVKFALSLSGDVAWILPKSRSISINEGKDYVLDTDSEQQSLNSISFSAGNDEDVSAIITKEELDAQKAKLKRLVVINVLIAIALTAALIATPIVLEKINKNSKNLDHPSTDEKEGINDKKNDTGSKFNTLIFSTRATSMLSTLGIFILIRVTLEKLSKKYTELSYISRMKIDKNGIAMDVGLHTHKTNVDIQEKGFTIETLRCLTPEVGNEVTSSIDVKDGGIDMRAESSIYLCCGKEDKNIITIKKNALILKHGEAILNLGQSSTYIKTENSSLDMNHGQLTLAAQGIKLG